MCFIISIICLIEFFFCDNFYKVDSDNLPMQLDIQYSMMWWSALSKNISSPVNETAYLYYLYLGYMAHFPYVPRVTRIPSKTNFTFGSLLCVILGKARSVHDVFLNDQTHVINGNCSISLYFTGAYFPQENFRVFRACRY